MAQTPTPTVLKKQKREGHFLFFIKLPMNLIKSNEPACVQHMYKRSSINCTMAQLSEYEIRSLQKLGEAIHEGKWSNDGLVQLIELVGNYLNPQSIQEYADKVDKTYNGIKKTKKTVILFKHKYIIDND